MSGARGTPLIAHIIFRLDVGGLENGVVNIVNRMPRDRYRHVIICLQGFAADFRRRITRDDVELFDIRKRPGKDLGAYLRVWNLLRRLRPDIVHTRNLGTVDLQWIALAAGVRGRVHGEHGWEASDPKGLDPRAVRIRRACRPVIHRYVPMSRDLANWLESVVRVDPGRVRQLYNGVDTEVFRPAQSRDCATSRLTVGTVGRLDPVKNQAALIRAVATLVSRHPEFRGHVRLVIAGDGPLRAQLVELARSLSVADHTEFLGARSDVPLVMRQFDVFALPSVNEGISNTILEAMASGLPVVAARTGGNPELVEDGVTGALYDPGREDALAATLADYLGDSQLREQQGRAARERAVDRFGIDGMIRRYVDLYDEVLACAA